MKQDFNSCLEQFNLDLNVIVAVRNPNIFIRYQHTHIDLLCVRLITTKAELEPLSKLCLM